MSYFMKVGPNRFAEMLKSYASGKDNLQAAIGAAVYQLFQGNPNWINQLFRDAGFWQSPVNGKARVSADGRLVFAYLTTSQAEGGCGLTGDMIRLDREKMEWSLVKGRELYISELDMEFLTELLDTVRFDRWGKTVVDKKTRIATQKYNPQVALSRIAKRIAESTADNAAGLDMEDVSGVLAELEAIRKAVMAAKNHGLKAVA
jgi:hypothetical protein